MEKVRFLLLLACWAVVCLAGYRAFAQSPVITSLCPMPVPGPNTTANSPFNSTIFISGQNFPQNASVQTDGPLALTGSPIISTDGTLIEQAYTIGCCGPQEGELFHVQVNAPGQGSTQATDTIILYNTEPVVSPCGPGGSWIWDLAFPFCPASGCPTLGYPVLSGDLWNMGDSTGNLTTAFNGALNTNVSFSNVYKGKDPNSPVIGYPNITYGYQPQACPPTPCPVTLSNPDFPLPQKISSFPTSWSMVNYSITPPSPPTAIDFSYDIWITHLHNPDGSCAQQVSVTNQDVELMIWTYSKGLGPGGLVKKFNNLSTWLNGRFAHPTWNAYVGPGSSGATRVSVVLKNGVAHRYIGVDLRQMNEAMIETLVTYGHGWNRSTLEGYCFNNVTLGSEFGCVGSNSKCSNFPANYTYNINDYCLAKGKNTKDWRDYQCAPLSMVASFDKTNGYAPVGLVVDSSNRKLYGVSYSTSGYGEVFSVNPLSWQITVVHAFVGSDGSAPSALLYGSDGNFYGTTTLGPGRNNNGEVFKMDPSGTVTVIHAFSFGDGSQPSYLIQGADGYLYGLTPFGGSGSPAVGVVFRCDMSGNNFKVLHSFSASDGAGPSALLPPQNGLLYGTTLGGGPNSVGEVFSMNSSDGSNFTIVYPFTGGSDGGSPAALVQTNGTFFGIGQESPNGSGTGELFQMTPQGNFSLIHSFTASEGGQLNSLAVVQTSNGAVLLGTAQAGGFSTGAGTIFEFNPATGHFGILYSFNGGNGSIPSVPLVQEPNAGPVYGAAFYGGNYNAGEVFQFAVPRE